MLPQFAEIIFREPDISEKGKLDFKINFLNKYLEDEMYRESVEGLYIFFIHGNFWNKLGKDVEDAQIPNDIPGYNILSTLVTNNPVKYYFY